MSPLRRLTSIQSKAKETQQELVECSEELGWEMCEQTKSNEQPGNLLDVSLTNSLTILTKTNDGSASFYRAHPQRSETKSQATLQDIFQEKRKKPRNKRKKRPKKVKRRDGRIQKGLGASILARSKGGA